MHGKGNFSHLSRVTYRKADDKSLWHDVRYHKSLDNAKARIASALETATKNDEHYKKFPEKYHVSPPIRSGLYRVPDKYIEHEIIPLKKK